MATFFDYNFAIAITLDSYKPRAHTIINNRHKNAEMKLSNFEFYVFVIVVVVVIFKFCVIFNVNEEVPKCQNAYSSFRRRRLKFLE